MGRVLIVPYGIEIPLKSMELKCVNVLIVPYGIEISSGQP